MSHAPIPASAPPRLSHTDLHTRVQPARRKASLGEGEVRLVPPEFLLMQSRMGLLMRHGRVESFADLFPDGFLTVGCDKMAVVIYSGGGEVLLDFISYTRNQAQPAVFTVNGREVTSAVSHSRRVLVLADGSAFPEIDGCISPFAKKYVAAAGQVMEARAKAARRGQ